MLSKTYHVMLNKVKHLAKLPAGFCERSLTLAPPGVDRWFAQLRMTPSQ